MAALAGSLVGRERELAAVEQLLGDVDGGRSAGIELVGEAGIGKTCLLSELATRADARGDLVLTGSGSELERDLPFSVFVDALDAYLRGLGMEAFANLDDDVQAELASVFPALSGLGRGRSVAPQHERYRTHRAVRALLEALGRGRPLVLILDDFHWADPGSIELLGALLRRPPATAVLTAVTFRPRQLPEPLLSALERAQRAGVLTRLELAPLSRLEARALLDGAVSDAEAALLYEETGGNPFYLDQLARSVDGATRRSSVPIASITDLGVPVAVAASLSEELRRLAGPVRRVLEGASVAGDPFEPELAAAAAETTESATMDAIDELLRLDVVRGTDVPRRFRFRHPIIRRAVYESTAGGWRLGAHERCAAALAARGAPAVTRAHHVERSARQGDVEAIGVLREAGEAATRLAPESAGRWFGAALRLFPSSAPAQDRIELLLARTKALAAAGRFVDSHEAALAAAALAPREPGALFTTVATACAGVERFLGRYEDAHARLVGALGVLPERPSVERVELLMELTLNEFYRSRYEAMGDWAAPAVEAAVRVGDPALIAASAVMPAFAATMTGPTETALVERAQAAALVDELSDDELSVRPHTAGWLAIAEVYLDLYAEADAHAGRALRLTRATGEGDPLHRLYPVLPRVWYVRGKLAEAAELLDNAIEAGRLLGSPPALAGNLFNRSVVALAVGDLEMALATAEESFALTRGLDPGFVSAWAAARLAAVRFETGQPDQAVELLLGHAGGDELTRIPGSWRSYWLELLTRCWLALDRPEKAAHAVDLARQTAASVGLPLAAAWADRADAAVALNGGDTARAIERSLASAGAAQEVGAPIEEALSRILAGRALAEAGERDRAVGELQRAAAALDACGAVHYCAGAERELGKLGHRPYRRSRAATGCTGIQSLTERELQVVRLVVDRRTNPEIAAALYLSPKTVETHLSNIFNKMGVATRVALARAVERSDQSAVASPGPGGGASSRFAARGGARVRVTRSDRSPSAVDAVAGRPSVDVIVGRSIR
jgi:ATP/maltotriose-dependent transcriptional regulator MalT